MKTPINYQQFPHNHILCIDMKSFFASIEAVARGFDPLKVCLAVVGDQSRTGSVVLAASPTLKGKYGIKTGSRFYEIPPVAEIKIIDARMGLYLERSVAITRFFNNFVPLTAIYVYSIDESWLQLDGTERLFGNPGQTALQIKKGLVQKFGLPSSMGLAPNMFLAKVAMDIEGKKKGLAEWTYHDVPEKLWPVKLIDCWGIGRRLAKRFKRIGVRTVGQLAHLPLEYLEKNFGIIGNQLYYHAWGIDLSKPGGNEHNAQAKSISRGITLLRDYGKEEEIKTVIFELCDEVSRRVRKNGLAGKTVSLGIGYSHAQESKGFYVQRTLSNYTNSPFVLYRTSLELLAENYQGQIVRRVNLALSNLVADASIHYSLFNNSLPEAKVNQTKDLLQDKYGHQALFYGRSLKSGSILTRMRTTIGGHVK